MDVELGIPEDDRKEVAAGLATLLAETYALYLKTQNYHWNVTGPRFREMHLTFEAQYRELADATDAIAERIRTLGFWAPATFIEFSRLSSLPEDEGVPPADSMVRALLEDHQAVLRRAREILKHSEAVGDHGTAALLAARIEAHEKTGWMLVASM